MRKSSRRWLWMGGIGMSVGLAIACGGGSGDDNNSGSDGGGSDATTGKDGALGSDGSIGDSGGNDASNDASLCTSNPCVTQISLAGDFSCALLSDKTLRCWGQNNSGQLAVGMTADGGFDAAPYSTPNPVTSFTGIDEVAAADFHGLNGWTCARAGTADVRCWGSDKYAQLGLGDASTVGLNTPHTNPAAVVGLPGATFISGSGGHTCAAMPGGNVSCWGDTVDEALGRATSVGFDPFAAPIEGGTANYVEVATGEAQSCALTQTGNVDCWGWNDRDQLGRPDAGVGSDVVPTTVPNLSGVVDLIGGRNFFCARTTVGAIDCWGENSSAELGRGIVSSSDGTATPIALPAGKKARLVGAADHTGCAVLDDDTVWCWGANNFGQLGSLDDAATSTADGGPDSVPRQVAGIGGKPIQIAGGQNHFCVLLESGGVTCWGANNSGQLGRGTGDGGDPDGVPHPDPKPVAF